MKKKFDITLFILSILAAACVAIAVNTSWKIHVALQTYDTYYSSPGGKKVCLSYYENRPSIDYCYYEIIGFDTHNLPTKMFRHDKIWESSREYYIIPPEIKITWISENEIRVTGTNFSGRGIDETVAVP